MVIKKTLKICSFLLLFCSMAIWAQDESFASTTEWYTMHNRAISNDGNWVFFTKNFDKGERRGVLLNSTNKKENLIENAGDFFLDNEYFIVLNGNKELLIKDLGSQKEQRFQDISDFQYDPIIKKLSLLQNGNFILLNLKNKHENKFLQIKQFVDIRNTPCTFLYGDNYVSLLNKVTGKSYQLPSNENQISAFYPVPDQEKIAVLLKTREDFQVAMINYYGKQMTSPQSIKFDKSFSRFNFLDSTAILASKPLLTEIQKKRDTVEVWSNNDKVLKPDLMNRYANAQSFELVDISSKNQPAKSFRNFISDYYLVFDGKYILESLTLENHDYFTSNTEPSPKIMLRNRLTDKIELEIDKVECFYPSKVQKYVLYFKNKNWYLFDLEFHTTKNLTSSANEKFFSIDRLNINLPYATDRPWFNEDYSAIYLTSRNNIWKYSLDEQQLVNLTKNSNTDASYKITQNFAGDIEFFKWNENTILSTEDLVLKISNIKNDLLEGLAVLKNGKLIIIEELQPKLIDNIQHSKEFITYVIQNANNPPNLISYALKKNIKKNIYKLLDKPLSQDFPKTVVREWINKKGQRTWTTIVLPSNYSPEKKYPVVVRIYENEAKRFKEFIYPTYYNPTGFNRIILAEKGYIVVLPEIKYSENNVGDSAVESVEETLKKAESWYSVDSKNIGLIGHSFGGYETMEILTKSKLFKAAISGSGIADIVSDYFTVHKDLRNSNISRYTNQQFGFSDRFYSLKKSYLNNNPILHADNINTPLLLFSGKNDVHVEWRQSVEMFMALSSLKKETRLLLFPNDAHVLVRAENQLESTKRILQWFDYYLKNKERPSWF